MRSDCDDPLADRVHPAARFDVLRCERRALYVDRRAITRMVERTLTQESANRRHAVTIAGPRGTVRGHRVKKEGPIACSPPSNRVEVQALLSADGLADREEAVVQDVVNFL